MNNLSWNEVQDRPFELLEFGACHVREAWRRHKAPQQMFHGLESAFATSDHRITRLLQEVGGNPNARNHAERGQALYAAVWFTDSPWAILCNPTHVTLVSRVSVERLPIEKGRNDNVTAYLKEAFEQSSTHLMRELSEAFYERVIRPIQQQT